MARVLIPLPSRDFDPTESAVTWKVCSERGHTIAFATPEGKPAAADDMMLTGCGLDPWGFLPGLNRVRLIGLLMRADSVGREAYAAMTRDPAHVQPCRWSEVFEKDFDGLVLPGGHRAGEAEIAAFGGYWQCQFLNRWASCEFHPFRDVQAREGGASGYWTLCDARASQNGA